MKKIIHYFIMLIALLLLNSGLQAQCFSMTVQHASIYHNGEVCLNIIVDTIGNNTKEVTVSDDTPVHYTESCTSFPCMIEWCYEQGAIDYLREIECRSTIGCFQDEGCIVVIEGYAPDRKNYSIDATSP